MLIMNTSEKYMKNIKDKIAIKHISINLKRSKKMIHLDIIENFNNSNNL